MKKNERDGTEEDGTIDNSGNSKENILSRNRKQVGDIHRDAIRLNQEVNAAI